MSEIDLAFLRFSIAMKNHIAIERKITSDYEKLVACKRKWADMSKISAQKRKLLRLARR